MDWLTMGVSLGGSLLIVLAGGGLAAVALNSRVFKHQVGKDHWQEYLETCTREIDLAEELGDHEKVTQLRIELARQLEARKAQLGFEAIAPRSIGLEESKGLTQEQVQNLLALLAQSRTINPAALSAEVYWLMGNTYSEDAQYEEA